MTLTLTPGEWLHRSLGGISPVADGYAAIRIAPRISASLGPSAVNASVETIRGRVISNWVRSEAGSVLRLTVGVPSGARALVLLPLLGRLPNAVEVDFHRLNPHLHRVIDDSPIRTAADHSHERLHEVPGRIWPQPATATATMGNGVQAVVLAAAESMAEGVSEADVEEDMLSVDVQAGMYTFVVRDRSA